MKKITSILMSVMLSSFLLFIACDNYEPPTYSYPEQTVGGFSPILGAEGTEVTINGSNFGTEPEAITIFFNGIAAKSDDISSIEDNKIMVKVPKGASSGIVSVKLWINTKDAEGEFTVLPSAVFNRIEPVAGISGEELIIYGENFGNDASQVSVNFNDGVEARIISVSETEIKVIIPGSGITGVITIEIGDQNFETTDFVYPLIGLDYLFNTDGDTEGWGTINNSTNEVSNGSMNVSFDMTASKRRADLKLTGGTTINVGGFPYLAIKLNKPTTGNFILDTNFGKYKNGSNNWEGILHGDIYYYDLRNTFGTDNTLSLTESTEFTTFQFKIADIVSDETGYSVDWIRSFVSLDALKEYTQLPNGKFIYEFDDPNPANDYWVGKQGSTNVIEDSKLKVTFDPSQVSGKRRSDLNFVEGGVFPGDSPNGKWHYDSAYPILAFKIAFVGTGAAIPGTGVLKMDRFNGTKSNAYLTKFIDDNVIYYDCSIEGGFTETQDLASFTLKIADVTSTEETGYEVDWIRSFATVEELQEFIEN